MDESMKAKRVALCTGGKAGRNFGTDGSSYALATGLGHTVTPLYPSLVQLKTDDRRIRTLRGVRVDCEVTAHCGGEMAAENAGEVIFGDGVVGGSAIYYISPFIAGKIQHSFQARTDAMFQWFVKSYLNKGIQ